MTLRTLMTAAAVVALAAPAFAQQATTTAQPVANPAPAATPKAKTADANHTVVCKTSGTTGTRLGGTRVCLTAEQWAERDEQTREVMERTTANANVH